MEREKIVVDKSDPFSPPKERLVRTSTDDLILSVLRELKISYPNELAAQTGFSQQTVLSRLAHMRVLGLVERVVLQERPPEDLAARLPFFWSQGLKGAQLRRCAWHRLVNDGKSKAEG